MRRVNTGGEAVTAHPRPSLAGLTCCKSVASVQQHAAISPHGGAWRCPNDVLRGGK